VEEAGAQRHHCTAAAFNLWHCCSEVDDEELRQLRSELSSLQVPHVDVMIFTRVLVRQFCDRRDTTKNCAAREKRRKKGCWSSCR
jgi:hypothetical protein